MTKKTFTILIILIVFLGAIGFFILLQTNKVPKLEIPETNEPDFIPFGGVGNQEVTDSADITDSDSEVNLGGRESFSDFNEIDSHLFQITNAPVSGYALFSKTIEITEEPTDTIDESLVETYNFFEFPSMKIGDSGEGVSALQTILNRLSEDTELGITSTFDTDTKNAVLAFQTKHKLAADGIVGNGTKAKLNEVQGLSVKPEDFEPTVRTEQKFTARYQDASNGHIYDFDVDTGTVQKISRTTFAGVGESFFGNNGDTVVVRYASGDDISTYVGDIINPGEVGYVEGEFLTQDIPFVSVSLDGESLVYFEEINRKTRGYLMDLVSKNTSIVFESSFSEWLPQFYGEHDFSLTSLASGLVPGFSYKYSADEKNDFVRGVGGFTGLTTNYNEDGSKVLYSTNNESRFIETYVYDFETQSTLNLGVKTLAEKCTWIDHDVVLCAVPRFVAPEDYPDAWYKGQVVFNDRLWSIDTSNGLEQVVSTLNHESFDRVDAINLEYKDGLLLFKNKDDLTLWGLDMK